MPPRYNQSISETLPFFHYKVFPVPCLPLSLGQAQVMVVCYSKWWINNLCFHLSGLSDFHSFPEGSNEISSSWIPTFNPVRYAPGPPVPSSLQCWVCVDMVSEHRVWALLSLLLRSLAISAQFDTWVLLLVPICLASLVEPGHSFSSLFSLFSASVLCYIVQEYCLSQSRTPDQHSFG